MERNVGRSTYLLEWTKNERLEEGKWWNREWEGIDEFRSCPDNRLELFEQGFERKRLFGRIFLVNFTIMENLSRVSG